MENIPKYSFNTVCRGVDSTWWQMKYGGGPRRLGLGYGSGNGEYEISFSKEVGLDNHRR